MNIVNKYCKMPVLGHLVTLNISDIRVKDISRGEYIGICI